MSGHQAELEKRLWAIANELRGNMGADEFRNYILGLIFFKFLSEKIERTGNDVLENGSIKYIKIESISNLKIDSNKCLFIDEITHKEELKRSILKENDILFAIAGSLGKTAIIQKQDLPANTNQALSIIRLKKNINYKFIFYILNSRQMTKYIYENLSVGAQPNLNLQQINDFTTQFPCLEE